MAHLPKEVLAKNFQTDESAFAQIPGSELYIFPGRASFLVQFTGLVLTVAYY